MINLAFEAWQCYEKCLIDEKSCVSFRTRLTSVNVKCARCEHAWNAECRAVELMLRPKCDMHALCDVLDNSA